MKHFDSWWPRLLLHASLGLCLLVAVEQWLPSAIEEVQVGGKETKQLLSSRGAKSYFKLELASGAWTNYYVSKAAYDAVRPGDSIVVHTAAVTREWQTMTVSDTGRVIHTDSAAWMRTMYALAGATLASYLLAVGGGHLLWLVIVWPLPLFYELARSVIF